MAITLETLRNERKKSIHGRELGIDPNSFLVGPKGHRIPITAGTSDTTGTVLPNHGIVLVTTTTNDTWQLDDPVEGAVVYVGTGSSSTGTHTIVGENATFLSSDSSTGAGLVMVGGAACVTLAGLSTAVWKVLSISLKTTASSSSGVYIST